MDQPTHILIHYRTQKAAQLFRASNGMLIGMKSGQEVRIGENPVTAETRLFINDEKALEYLKSKAIPEPDSAFAIFDEREGEPRVQLANGPLAGMRN